MSERERIGTPCSACGAPVKECACCDEADCAVAICYRCLTIAVGQQVPQPHVHGG